MARIRSVKPEYWTSEQVVECSTIARLAFLGLWNFCDDGGCHPASLARWKMQVFPADPISPDQMKSIRDELITHGLLETYVVAGQEFWRVTGWHHQKIESPTYLYPRSREFGEESARRRRGFAGGSPPESSRVESSRKETSCGEDATNGDGSVNANGSEHGTGDGADATSEANSKANGKGYPELFEAFWLAYPTRGGRKRGKRKCFGIWRQAIRAAERQSLVEAAIHYAASGDSTRGFARDPERFLNAEWWRDWIPTLAVIPPVPVAPKAIPRQIEPAGWEDV